MHGPTRVFWANLTPSSLQADTDASAGGARDRAVVGFDGVDLVTPGGECLAKALSVRIEPGRSLMVTGPNASGKSSFFRALGGLWPSHSGHVFGPRDDVFLVPQRVYSSMGTLADQVPNTAPRDL
jgi:ATP-binding cassette subfamily D (ALD) long-chain fatty acid import protein